MRKVFVIKKYIVADNIQEALGYDKNAPVHECYLEETSTKMLIEELSETNITVGFKKGHE